MQRGVLKFGGSSVANIEKMKEIAIFLKKRIERGEQLIVVVSAMGETTDRLMDSVHTITSNPESEDVAVLLTTGEQQTIAYLSLVLNDIGVKSKALTGYQAGIRTEGSHLESKISNIDTDLFESLFETYSLLIVAGFQGFNADHEMTTLGRGGSDTTAVALAAAEGGASCEIYTDVAGVYGTDPRIYAAAKRLDVVTYEELMEMSALGAGVVVSRSIEIANNHNVPIYIGKTLSDEEGTWVMPTMEMIEKKVVTGVTLDTDMLHVTLIHPEAGTELINDVFMKLEQHDMNVDMISQIADDEGLQLSFTLKNMDDHCIQQIFSDLESIYPDLVVKTEDTFVKVSVVGSGMRDVSGVASKVFRTLMEGNIRFHQVTTSEISISHVVDAKDGEEAVRRLCEAFEL